MVKTQQTFDHTLKKYAMRTDQYKLLLKKYAELEDENKKLKKDVSDTTEGSEKTKTDAKAAVEKATAAVKKGAEAATDPEETTAVSDVAKNALVDAVARIDSEAGDELAEAVDDAEAINGEKLAGMMVDVFRSIGSRVDSGSGSLVPGSRMRKKASRTTDHSGRLEAQMDELRGM